MSAFLLVPGCVNTSDCPRFELGTHRPADPLIPCATRALSVIRTRGDKWIEGADFKPDRAKDEREYNGVRDRAFAAKKWAERGAWQPDQVIDELFCAIAAGTPFYIICQDGETTRAMDDGRMQWAADDVVFRRAPLSRWSDDFKDEFAAVAKQFV